MVKAIPSASFEGITVWEKQFRLHLLKALLCGKSNSSASFEGITVW